MQNATKISKFLSLILRHKPEAIGIELDENGWTDVEGLLQKMNSNGLGVDMALLEFVVDTNDKKRFCFNGDKTKIRASQGHSVSVDVELQLTVPPNVLYHGTAERFCESIMQSGLLKQSRNHVHLSADMDTAIAVGKRHGSPAVLKVDAGAMHKAGYEFYISANNVWLTDGVPAEYLEKIK